MTTNREEKALREFKQIMRDLLRLLARSVDVPVAYLYWVNRYRKQFVLETSTTTLSNVMFKDRIDFDRHFLDDFKNIAGILQLETGRNIREEELSHYFDGNTARHITLLPFQNNGQTVALSVLEGKDLLSLRKYEEEITAYRNAHLKVLNTYLELTDLYQDQQIWTDYDKDLEQLSTARQSHEMITRMVNSMQKWLPDGAVTVALKGMGTWVTALRSEQASNAPELGLMVEEKTLSYECLQRGESIFTMHFNQNPKRFSSSESGTDGATLAIPLIINDRRHAAVLATDKNPIHFNESVSHQLKNIVRIAALSIRSNMPAGESGFGDLFTTEYGSFIPELMKESLKGILHRRQGKNEACWFGLISIDNLASLRTRHSVAELKELQTLLVRALNPARLGYNGFIGLHSDYIFSYLFTLDNEELHRSWLETNFRDVQSKIVLGGGAPVEVHLKAGFLKAENGDADQIIDGAKKALNTAMNNRELSYVQV
ncbi:MAG: GAF domain-containing protein [Balneolaceae bacterium]|nr:MAG: GAF domain-containing protein [Balneolaceae bacterium]